jgi:hypothetical protein
VKSNKTILLLAFTVALIGLMALNGGPEHDPDNIVGVPPENDSEGVSEDIGREPLILGFCPTMGHVAREIEGLDSGVSLRLYGATSTSITALKNGAVDAILVGRTVKQSELAEPLELRLRKGHTLVGQNKRFVWLQDLRDMRVHTAADKNTVNSYLPDARNVIYYASTTQALSQGLGDSVLLSWDEYSDDMELVIPVYANMDKVEQFRLPVIYCLEQKHIQRLNNTIKNKYSNI